MARTIVVLFLIVACSKKQEARMDADSACARVEKTLGFYQRSQEAYDRFVAEAEAKGWTDAQYRKAVEAWINAGFPDEKKPAVDRTGPQPKTNPCTCEVSGVEEDCEDNRKAGRPAIFCDVTRAHEEVHRQQCIANDKLRDSDPLKIKCDENGNADVTPAQRARWEHDAYEVLLALLRGHYTNDCGPPCKTMPKAREWTGTITINYQRTNQADRWSEKLTGDAAYTSKLRLPEVGVSVGGYSKLWMGPARGRAQFETVETSSDNKPFRGAGAGPLVDEPPIGKFTGEILRIDPVKCVYGFETSAAINSTWSDGVTRVDGAQVVLGTLPIAKTLAGTKTMSLPVAHHDWPGPAVMLPNEPVDWKARGRLGGSITISWTFTPTK